MMLSGCSTWPSDFVKKYKDSQCWRGETFGEMLRERANLYGKRIAVTAGDHEISYLELDHRADQLASGLQQMGIQKGNRVVVQLPNTIEFFEVCFALFRLGAVPVLALPTHRYSEISYFCGFTEAVAYIIPGSGAGFDYASLATKVQEEAASLKHVFVTGEGNGSGFTSLADLYDPSPMVEVQISGEDVALFQLSGGSTGLPKFIPRTHNDYIYSLRMSNEVCQMNVDSVYLAVLPVAHNFPLSSPGVLGTLYAGGRVVLSSGSSPDEAFPLIEKEQVTITAMVPPIALIWLEGVKTRTFDFSSLKVMQVGGAKFSTEMAKRVKPAFGCTLQQVFGMAEGLVNYTRLDDPDHLIHETQGRPMSSFDELRIVDEEDQEVPQGEAGELLTRGPYTIRGYYKAEEHNARSFTADGFYRTGDIVRLSKEGYIIVEGRNKDQINRGGEKIAAEEVENHLLAHPDLLDVSIVSMPDSFLGERSCAFMIVRENRPAPSEIRRFLQDRGLAAYKIPDRIEYIDQFPKTPLGKVSKKMLRQMIVEKMTLKKV
ncbi:2,3-dihydroxybenzoate-AMP ligase [Croceifilum oryzae]|uniref:2,3-dihydroxybenzoate-AMP ligase n=2 Tax=Croceifilum oryzae TaxID=1553429 RepID=A0AAJ1TGG7_9BACL|nr:2,3-dihydroxybenzoate-AMP ligase [Croceifilum oryzae]